MLAQQQFNDQSNLKEDVIGVYAFWKRKQDMGLAESVSLLRQATTLAEVLDRLEDKKASPKATSRPAPNVVFLCEYRQQSQQQKP